MTLDGFEVFSPSLRSRRFGTVPMVSILRAGHFSLNRPAYEALGSPSAVLLLYDRHAGIIGFRASDQNDPRAFRIGVNKQGQCLVSGKSLLRYYGIGHDKARRYAATLHGDILGIALDGERPAKERQS